MNPYEAEKLITESLNEIKNVWVEKGIEWDYEIRKFDIGKRKKIEIHCGVGLKICTNKFTFESEVDWNRIISVLVKSGINYSYEQTIELSRSGILPKYGVSQHKQPLTPDEVYEKPKKSLKYFSVVENIRTANAIESQKLAKINELTRFYFSPLTKQMFIDVFAGWIISKRDGYIYNAENQAIFFNEGSGGITYDFDRKTQGKAIFLQFQPKNIEETISQFESVGMKLIFNEKVLDFINNI